MSDATFVPVTLESFRDILVEAGLEGTRIEEERGCVTFDYAGDNGPLRMSVIPGRVSPEEEPWFARFISYSLTFEPIKAGVPRGRLLDWLNEKNADVFFGRFYHDDKTDTVVFEVSMPCGGGVNSQDFIRLAQIALLFVDRIHKELKDLAPTDVDA